MKIYWNNNNKVSFACGVILILLAIPVLIMGKSKGIIHHAEGFESRLIGIMEILLGLFFISSIYTNKKDKDTSTPGFILLVIAIPILEFMAHTITIWLGK